jgi:SagB-type dehydrogenase family enzyme
MTETNRNVKSPDQPGEPPGAAESASGSQSASIGDDRFLEQASQGEALLERGQAREALTIFRMLLAGLDEAPSYRRAVVLERLGRCTFLVEGPPHAAALFQEAMDVTESLALTPNVGALQGVLQSGIGDALNAIGRLDEARRAYEAAVAVAQHAKDRRAEGVDRDHLGALALRQGRLDDARTQHEAALALFRELGEPISQAVAEHHLGDVCFAESAWDKAEAHYTAAVRLREECKDWTGAAQSYLRVAGCCENAGRPEEAERGLRKAIETAGQTRNTLMVRRYLMELARFLQRQEGRLGEARQAADAALSSLTLETYAPDVWSLYGLRAEIAEAEAATVEDTQTRAACEGMARAYKGIEQYGPRLHTTLVRLPPEPGYARVVIMGRLGRCFLMGRRPALAAAFLGAALSQSEELTSSDDVTALRVVLEIDLGDALRSGDRHDEALKSYERAIAAAEDAGDRRGHTLAIERVLSLGDSVPEAARAEHQAALDDLKQDPAGGGELCITIYDEIAIDCVFDTDLLVDVAHTSARTPWTETAEPLADDIRPMLAPTTRTYVDTAGAVRFSLSLPEPNLDRHADCVVMRKAHREVAIAGADGVIWQLVRTLDGTRTVKDLIGELADGDRATGVQLLAVLAACGVLDVSGRTVGSFVHAATKKGVLLGGGLEGDDVLRLATDGDYRTHPDAERLALSDAVPESLASFHALTRTRRSRRDYAGGAISEEQLAALLNTACGVTGAMPWEGRDLKLRAYPSSGALYAVEIYPTVFRVDGMPPGVYHYAAGDSLLENITPDADAIVEASLPVERAMVSGAAAMICLVGEFRRHERKYGEGGYRMMVAEAGHISQNLVLAATALGLAARPFGGVFDGLMNSALHLDGNDEQFLLAVLVGHAGEVAKAKDEPT